MKRGVQLELNAPRVNWPVLQSQSLECVLSDRTYPLPLSFTLSLCPATLVHPLIHSPSFDTCMSRDAHPSAHPSFIHSLLSWTSPPVFLSPPCSSHPLLSSTHSLGVYFHSLLPTLPHFLSLLIFLFLSL